MEPHQERKLDDILAGLSALSPQVADLKTDVKDLDSGIRAIQIDQAVQKKASENSEKHIDAIGSKLRGHVDDSKIHGGHSGPAPAPDHWTGATQRWKFVASFTAAVLAVSTALSMAAQAFLGK